MAAGIKLDIFNQLRDILESEFMIVIEGFFSEGEGLSKKIERGVKEGDFEGVMHAAHSMKSMSGNLGAMNLSVCADDLQKAAINENIEAMKKHWPVYKGLYEDAVVEIKSLL